MGKRFLLIVLICMMVLAGAGCTEVQSSESRDCDEPVATVAPQDKVLYPDIGSHERPSLENLCSYSHAVIRGRILSMEEGTIPTEILVMDQEFVETKEKRYTEVEVAVTNYQVKIDEVLYGDLSRGDTILYTLWGGLDSDMTKPQEPGAAVLLMSAYQYPDKQLFTSVGKEHGVFTVDPCGRVYSYSNFEELCAYDGQDVSVLENDLEQVIQELMDSGHEWPEVPILE